MMLLKHNAPQCKVKYFALLLSLHLLVCAALNAQAASYEDKFGAFENARPVQILNLPLADDGTPISTEEPFISRNDRFLFFNSGERENNKDLHYAEFDGTQWVYRGEVGPNVNNEVDVQGNATMDNAYNFYYTESHVDSMVRSASFSPASGQLVSLSEIAGVPIRTVDLSVQTIEGNMGIEISADGKILFFDRATWPLIDGGVGMVLASDILFAKKKEGVFVYKRRRAKRIMRNINTADLEYAESISSDGLELFLTRLALTDLSAGLLRSKIMRSTRGSLRAAFALPVEISAIGSSDFVEGPAISGDGTRLFYHKREGAKFGIYVVERKPL